jgi:hypothetical protein
MEYVVEVESMNAMGKVLYCNRKAYLWLCGIMARNGPSRPLRN